MRANNPIETQEVTSDSKECDFQIFSPGVHTIFLLATSPILDFRAQIGHFSEKITMFFPRLSGALVSALGQRYSSERKN